MRDGIAFILHALALQTHGANLGANHTRDTQDSMGKLVDKVVDALFDQALKLLPLHYSELRGTTLVKPGHVRIPRQVSPFPSRASHLPVSSSLLPHRCHFARDSGIVKASKYSLIASGTNMPHPDKVAKGGEDAWFIKANEKGGGAIAVIDGVGGYSKYDIDPGLYAKVLAYEVDKAYDSCFNLKGAIAEAQSNTKLPGASTVCVVEVEDTKLRAANLGDSGFRVIRDGKIVLASPSLQHFFNCPYQLAYEALIDKEQSKIMSNTADDAQTFDFDVQPGDLVVAGSDGLFDNVFDSEVARVATEAAKGGGGGTLTATKAASDALVKLARKNAEDPNLESPYILEMRADIESKQGFLGKMMAKTKKGGKMDDITVVVGMVVETRSATDLPEAVAESAELGKMIEDVREKARPAEARTDAIVKQRARDKENEKYEEQLTMQAVMGGRMGAAGNINLKRVASKSAEDSGGPGLFTAEEIEAMDKFTVRQLLEKNGLPTSGKLATLKERLAQVKSKPGP